MPDSAPLPSAKLMPKVEELRVTTGPFPASRKVHVPGQLHSEISVAMREIDLDPEVAPFQWTVCQLAVYVLVMAARMSATSRIPDLRPLLFGKGMNEVIPSEILQRHSTRQHSIRHPIRSALAAASPFPASDRQGRSERADLYGFQD
jgi:hypothetical protein